MIPNPAPWTCAVHGARSEISRLAFTYNGERKRALTYNGRVPGPGNEATHAMRRGLQDALDSECLAVCLLILPDGLPRQDGIHYAIGMVRERE